LSESRAQLESERFEIKERLGSGGMGAVYRAFDRERSIDVALKALVRADGQTIYRFKREFRSLADIVHDNLVTLYELLSVGEEWFFTMELVEGVSFLEHVRPYHHLIDGDSLSLRTPLPPGQDTVTSPTRPSSTDPRVSPHRKYISSAELHRERLHPALRQLVEAVRVLHEHGKLHRDIKPSNVLVTPRGRLVLCDFGLIVQKEEEGRTRELSAVGTPSYMSPEQAANRAVTEASDWYSVGVILFEALTGRLPHEGSLDEVLRLKQEMDAPSPRELDPDVPDDLEDLCRLLLHRDPDQRPSGEQIVALAGSRPQTAPAVAVEKERRTGFVGRAAELDVLRKALADTRSGSSVAMFVHGFSGMGKTALVRHFLEEASAEREIVILEGRCYERESVPYKALDTLVDALSSYLLTRPYSEVEAIMPRDAVQLARLFPVLRRVKAVAAPKVRSFEPPDPQESRRRGFAALRVLLQRLADIRPVILFIDDLQWGDVDSAAFISDLCTHPDRPSALLLTCYRREDTDSSPLLRALSKLRVSGQGDVREIAVEQLSDKDARAVVTRIFREVGSGEAEHVDEVIAESGRNPYLLAELAHASAREQSTSAVSLDHFLRRRIDALPEDARALLTVAAVAGRPLPTVVAAKAAALRVERAAVAVLCAERLARTRQIGEQHEIEPYHDRIRETLVASLDEERLQSTHRSVAAALEKTDRSDLQALVEHWLSAGDIGKAGRYAARAAVQAERALAFDRAAHYFALALKLQDLPPDKRHARQVRLADALANAGRLLDAADAYLKAAEGTDPSTELDMRRKAVEHLLHGGRLEEGLAQTAKVLDAVGLRLPRSSRRALFAILWRRLRIRLRGLEFEETPEIDVPAEEIKRLDVCYATSSGLSFVDPLLGKAYQMQHMLDALSAGEPVRIALALCLEMGYVTLAGVKGRERADSLFERTLELAERVGNPRALGLTHGSYAVACFLTGRWRPCVDHSRVGMKIFRDQCTDVRWEIGITQIFYTSGLLYVGAIGDLVRTTPTLVREAIERGDQYAGNGLRAWRSNIVWLAMDAPGEAREQAERGSVSAKGEDFHLHHYYESFSHVQIDLYQGDAELAWSRLERLVQGLKRSMLLRIQSVRIESAFLQARCALTLATDGRSRDEMWRVADNAARRIEKEKTHWGNPMAVLVRGQVARLRGDEALALRLLSDAFVAFQEADMALFAAVARRRRGELMSGERGAAEVRAANEWMKEQLIVSPERMVALFAPVTGR